MAVIKVIDDYQVFINLNKDHEARIDLHKTYKDSKSGEFRPQYKIIGHYSNMINACGGILRHMNIEKAGEKDIITVKEYIDIMKANQELMQKILTSEFNEEP